MDDRITALERLAKLKSEGTISEAEFEAQKAQLFAAQFVPPLHRRLWVVATLTALIFTFWIALAILASGQVYRKRHDGWIALTKGSRWTYAGFLTVWLFALVAKTIVQPNYWDIGWDNKGVVSDAKKDQAPSTAAKEPAKATNTDPAQNHLPPAAFGTAEVQGAITTYTNARYNYSIVYRTDLLNIEPEAPNGDGVTLHSKDRSAVVRVFAEYNATGQTPEAIEKDAAKNCVNPSAIMAQADPTLVNVICEVSGDAIHFTRVVIKDDLLVTMDAEYPKADQLIWNPVMGRMAVSMKVGP